MNKQLLATLPLLAAFATPRAEEEISFRPSEGLAFTFVFTQETELELAEQSGSGSRGDEEMEMPDVDVDLTLVREQRIVFKDEIQEVGDGRIRKLRRTFDEITQTESTEYSGPEGDNSDESDGASDLEGMTVVFTWDDDEEEFIVEFEDEDGDEDLLEDLVCDIDFRGFLPSGAVSRGDSWDVDIEAFDQMLDPGGDLHILGEDEEEGDDDEISDQIDDNLDGEVTCKLAEIREEGGVRIAVIEIKAIAETGADMDADFDTPYGSGSMSQEIRIGFDLEGQLLWNLASGHFAGFELEGDFSYATDVSQEIPDMEFSVEQTQEFEGTATFRAEVEYSS